MIVVALHGFFGSPDDWRTALKTLNTGSNADLNIDLVAPDLAVWATRSSITDFETFSATLNRSVRMLSEERGGEKVVIAGYSLGARLAAFCLLDEPDLYSAGLFISMNPGIKAGDFQARRDRVAFDSTWSERMRRDPWESTWKAWNDQPVLKPGSRAPKKDEMRLVKPGTKEEILDDAEKMRRLSGRREAWARAMDIWTLGLQADLRKDLVDWAAEDIGGEKGRRVTLMTGVEDVKFSGLIEEWLADGKAPDAIRHCRVEGAGHRVLFEAPQEVVTELSALF
jgi:pimeloyl-ACP methyl ester carboxylesterase